MSVKLPSLNSIRAFEAAARHLSFTRAAEEMHVTQSAVSHQIKALEEFLGLKLFRRLNRALLLTDEGQEYLPAVRKAFDQLHEATRRLVEREARGKLTVSVLPSFAARWLVPRLGRFVQAYPEIDIRLMPTADLVDFSRDDVDVGIRYGRGHYPGLRIDRLMDEDVFPVCSPELLKPPHALKHPEDLAYHILMHDDGHGDWRTWLLSSGIENIDPQRGPIFTDSSFLIQAAIAGQGVALARSALVQDDLDNGNLVRPFELSLSVEFAYYLVCPEEVEDQTKIVAFRNWIIAESGSYGLVSSHGPSSS